MSKTISFVASDQLADFLEEESDRRMTSVSSTAQILLAEKVREEMSEEDGAEVGKTDQTQFEPLQSDRIFEFPSREGAKDLRSEFSEYETGRFDGRHKSIEFREGTPGEVVEVLERESEG